MSPPAATQRESEPVFVRINSQTLWEGSECIKTKVRVREEAGNIQILQTAGQEEGIRPHKLRSRTVDDLLIGVRD